MHYTYAVRPGCDGENGARSEIMKTSTLKRITLDMLLRRVIEWREDVEIEMHKHTKFGTLYIIICPDYSKEILNIALK